MWCDYSNVIFAQIILSWSNKNKCFWGFSNIAQSFFDAFLQLPWKPTVCHKIHQICSLHSLKYHWVIATPLVPRTGSFKYTSVQNLFLMWAFMPWKTWMLPLKVARVLRELSMSQYSWPYLQCICQQDRKDPDIRSTLFICKFVSQVEKQTGAVLKRQETIHCWEVLWKKNLRSKLELTFSVAC